MSEYASINIKGLSLALFRNYLKKDIVELIYSSQDLLIIPNYIDDPEDKDSTPYTKYMYKTTVKKASDRLDVLGYGLSRFEKLFNQKTIEAVDYYPFLSYLHVDYDEIEEKAQSRIDNVTFKKWTNSMKKIIFYELEHGNITFYRNNNSFKPSTECDKIIYHALKQTESDSFYGIKGEIINEAFVLRLILEICNDEDEIVLDFTNLSNWSDDCISKAIEVTGNAEKIIVLVEGTSDKDMLEFALKNLYPHLTDLFYFMDFSNEYGNKRAGGTSEIRKHMETFYYSKLRAKFIAIFDNDAVGYHNKFLLLNQIKEWPDNFSIKCYPELNEFKKYPTLAPNGSVVIDDINKKACSIELYLPDYIISGVDGFFPIEWENREAIKKLDGVTEYLYQGVISNKDDIKKKFHDIRKKIDNKEISFNADDWLKMKELLGEILFAFK